MNRALVVRSVLPAMTRGLLVLVFASCSRSDAQVAAGLATAEATPRPVLRRAVAANKLTPTEDQPGARKVGEMSELSGDVCGNVWQPPVGVSFAAGLFAATHGAPTPVSGSLLGRQKRGFDLLQGAVPSGVVFDLFRSLLLVRQRSQLLNKFC